MVNNDHTIVCNSPMPARLYIFLSANIVFHPLRLIDLAFGMGLVHNHCLNILIWPSNIVLRAFATGLYTMAPICNKETKQLRPAFTYILHIIICTFISIFYSFVSQTPKTLVVYLCEL
jgi:hypothetical protein